MCWCSFLLSFKTQNIHHWHTVCIKNKKPVSFPKQINMKNGTNTKKKRMSYAFGRLKKIQTVPLKSYRPFNCIPERIKTISENAIEILHIIKIHTHTKKGKRAMRARCIKNASYLLLIFPIPKSYMTVSNPAIVCLFSLIKKAIIYWTSVLSSLICQNIGTKPKKKKKQQRKQCECKKNRLIFPSGSSRHLFFCYAVQDVKKVRVDADVLHGIRIYQGRWKSFRLNATTTARSHSLFSYEKGSASLVW